VRIPRPQIFLLAIIALAVALRLALAFAHPFFFPDSADYDTLARAIAHLQPYETHGLLATRMPGYPLFLAPFYALLGPSVRAILIVQSLLAAVTVYLVYLLANRLSPHVALLAAALAAIDPLSLGFSAALLSEAPFTLLLLTALWLLLRAMDSGRLTGWLLFGITWAAAVYMRASALWCAVPLLLWAIVNLRARSKIPTALCGSLLAFVILLLSLLPWQLRNYDLFHEDFFRLTTLEGISLYEAVYPAADGSPKQDTLPLPPEMVPMNESQRNDEWSRRAWQDIRDNPARIAELALKKIARTWSPTLNAIGFRSPALQLALLLWHIPLFLFALFSLFAAKIPMKMKGLLLIPILYFTAVHALFLGSVRYRVPLMPLVCVFAAAGLVELISRFRKPSFPKTV
jgi:4-amino-4-deoxy-L-arabinose transferase-like glycosyltransferase